MTTDEYNALYKKYISGNCTTEECEIIEAYQDSFHMSDQPWDPHSMGDAAHTKYRITEKINTNIRRSERGKVIFIKTWYAAASVILLMIPAFLYLGPFKDESLADQARKAPVVKNDILPGKNKAILILDDGSRINLDDAESGLLAEENSTVITKLPDGQLQYAAGKTKSGGEIKFNTVSTPYGGQFQITLPDGSRVWLNAGSSLRFPTLFTGSERKVDLTGEAYFEIAKNTSMPFKVMSNNSEIRVLGTHFNVMAYEDEKQMKTTLLEGSVQIFNGANKIDIKPGQAAVLNKVTKKMIVATVDADQAVAWKNGYFIFVDENIGSIMRKVARWYNIEVLYKGNLSNKDFTGTISRNKNVSELLSMLELTGAVHFNIDRNDLSGKGGRITVMP